MKNASKETVIRTVLLLLAIINNGLALFGKSPLPIDDATVIAVVSFIFITATALRTWWKNNSFTAPAVLADQFLKEQKKKMKEEKLKNEGN